MTQYVSSSKQALQKQIQNPFSVSDKVQRASQTIASKDVSGELEYMINNTPQGQFTPIVDVSGQYAAFYIKSKEGTQAKPFEQVKQEVQQSWQQQQRQQVVKLHFEKLRAKTQIEIIR